MYTLITPELGPAERSLSRRASRAALPLPVPQAVTVLWHAVTQSVTFRDLPQCRGPTSPTTAAGPGPTGRN